MNAVETFEVGHATVNIYPDEDSHHLDPTEDDEAIVLALFLRNQVNPADRHGIHAPDDVNTFLENNGGTGIWEAFPVYYYEHGMCAYRVSRGENPFSCKWDSGWAGLMLVKIADVDDPWKAAQIMAEQYTHWANGSAYGYVVSVPDKDDADSCWGFLGYSNDEYLTSEATSAAQYESDRYAERLAEKTDRENESWARELEASRPDMYAA